MRLPDRPSRRGQPLVALGLVLLAWIGARTAVLASDDNDEAAHLSGVELAPPPAAPETAKPAQSSAPTEGTGNDSGRSSVAPRTIVPNPRVSPTTSAPPAPSVSAGQGPVSPRIAAGHQLLMMAGLSALPLPDEAQAAAASAPSAALARVPYLPTAVVEARRWSVDGWMLWREGGNGFNLPGSGLPGANPPSGAYGASQAGAVLRYRLVPASHHRPTVYLRATSGLQYPRGEELAAGFALRPLPNLPVAVLGEGRVTRTPSGTITRPAAAVVTELPPLALPFRLRAELYGQAGWVGGKDETPFIDGQARVERPVARTGPVELRVGAGAWGGAQRGTGRIDVGPTATLDLPLGSGGSRLSADYRFRVTGRAAPGSGPAVTLSAGF